MKAQVHHVAINVKDFDWHVHFFQELFQMEVRKISGLTPERKVWFHQGIQLNETPVTHDATGLFDHIGISVDNIEETVQKALEVGCTPLPNGRNWFALPEGTRIELILN
ncbi:MAG: VOC family protein [Bariatricus sp.]